MKRPLETALWCDCENDEERIYFLSSGRAYETGIIAKELIPQIIGIYMESIRLRAEKVEIVEKLSDIESGLERICVCSEYEDPVGMARKLLYKIKGI